MQMTKGERLVAEMLGDMPQTGMPVLTEEHPFLRKVIAFMRTRKEWLGTATDLLNAIGDNYTPPNTVTKLLRKYDYQFLYKEKGTVICSVTCRKIQTTSQQVLILKRT